MPKKFNKNRKPEGLPFRPIGECFLLYKGKLVAQKGINQNNKKLFLSLPGGGIDKGETPKKGATRELMEELGAELKSPLKEISVLEWDWHKQWPDNDKRKGRYMKFRGERVHFFIGEVKKFAKPTSDEGDEWKGKKTMSLSKAYKRASDDIKSRKEKDGYYNYNYAKLNIISVLNQLNKMKKIK